ncbi:hypothetical protein HDA32_005725 [Spinactinospora alkalitolerans]|uniref:DUF397 domain-containing protein n=1 Tax=Spinactinospora alkalitolerans TaxID=687207 RepID=A0A852U4Y8_9ACTN|nr:DUF397 domain-containing protein [Spinactinospora alkalitolerans]NYE50605.1 hypothetical protein [Spinactinospora alkalitolerans]
MPEQSHLAFRKSSYSSGTGQNCVEVAETSAGTAVRDSQSQHLGHIEFGTVEWRAFIADVKADRL